LARSLPAPALLRWTEAVGKSRAVSPDLVAGVRVVATAPSPPLGRDGGEALVVELEDG